MFTSKIVKKICYTILILELIASVVMIVLGIESIIKKEVGGILLIIGIILPIVAILSVYPMLALANIDENLQALNEKVDDISLKVNSHNSQRSTQQRVYTNNYAYSNVKKVDNLVSDKNNNNTNYKSKNESNIDRPIPETTEKYECNSSAVLIEYISDLEVMNFINHKYSINIELDDDVDTIKRKIENIIVSEHPTAGILKSKISQSKDIKEIVDVLNMHKAVYG